MNTAQEHALEQANLIAQLVKYADRLIVVESASPPERHDFVELVAERLPDTIETRVITAGPGNLPQEIIPLVTESLQLSPGIESPRQLAAAVHEALTAQGRMLVIIENVNAWVNTESWPELLLMLRAAHELAPNHLLFLLTGEIDLTDTLRAEPELAEMQGDMHQCLLLDAAFANAAPNPDTAQGQANTRADTQVNSPTKSPKKNSESPKEEALVANLKNPGSSTAPARRPFNPTLLIIAAFSVAVVSFGGFALLTRTSDHGVASKSLPIEPTPQNLALSTGTPDTPASPPAPTTPSPQPGNPLPNDGDQTAKTGALAPQPVETAPPTQHLEPVPATPAPHETSSADTTPRPAINDNIGKSTAATPPTATKPVEKTESPHSASKSAPPAKPVVAHKPSPEPRKHQAADAAATPVDNDWYRARPKTHATLQLGAFTEAQAARRFIQKHEATTNLKGWHIFSQRPKSKMLYTVTIGDFSSLTAARQAVDKLPESLRQSKPYPRSFNAIHQVLTK